MSTLTDLMKEVFNKYARKEEILGLAKKTDIPDVSNVLRYNKPITIQCAELTGQGATNGGFLDFHFANNSADYTSRIIEDASGRLSIKAPNGVRLDGSNIINDYVTQRYQNGANWYRIYKSGWCEQGGVADKNITTITLLKAYKDTNYGVSLESINGTNNNDTSHAILRSLGTNSFEIRTGQYGTAQRSTQYSIVWQASGFIS